MGEDVGEDMGEGEDVVVAQHFRCGLLAPRLCECVC